jgi:hypothetical protein
VYLFTGGEAMLPVFLVEETTVRESGQSIVFDANNHSNHDILLTFGITHALENESIGIDIHGSKDGLTWPLKPLVSFTPKFYCGTYQLILPRCEQRYLKAAWRVLRWSHGNDQPFFRFYIFAQPALARAATAGAA